MRESATALLRVLSNGNPSTQDIARCISFDPVLVFELLLSLRVIGKIAEIGRERIEILKQVDSLFRRDFTVEFERGEALPPHVGGLFANVDLRDLPVHLALDVAHDGFQLGIGLIGEGDTPPKEIDPRRLGPAIADARLALRAPVGREFDADARMRHGGAGRGLVVVLVDGGVGVAVMKEVVEHELAQVGGRGEVDIVRGC